MNGSGAWPIDHIRASLVEDRKDGPGVSHEHVMEWINPGEPISVC